MESKSPHFCFWNLRERKKKGGRRVSLVCCQKSLAHEFTPAPSTSLSKQRRREKKVAPAPAGAVLCLSTPESAGLSRKHLFFHLGASKGSEGGGKIEIAHIHCQRSSNANSYYGLAEEGGKKKRNSAFSLLGVVSVRKRRSAPPHAPEK